MSRCQAPACTNVFCLPAARRSWASPLPTSPSASWTWVFTRRRLISRGSSLRESDRSSARVFLVTPWVYGRVSHGGEASVPAAVWLAIDFLFVIWLFAAELIGVALAVCTWTTWRVVVRRRQLVASEIA